MLSIKDPEAHRLAKELAALNQTTMTEAVISALHSALDEHGRTRMRRRHAMEGLIAAAREQGIPDAGSAFDDLYDTNTGLPR